MSELNLYRRRSNAKKAVYEHEFQKVITAGLKYKYLPIEQIKPVVEKAWNDAGIVLDIIAIDLDDLREPWDVKSQYSGELTRWYHTKGTLTIALVNIDNPSDRAEFRIVGEAKDNSDKVINKIYTAAMKNFYKIEFNIAESPKDDTDATQDDEALKKQDDPFFGKKEKKEGPSVKAGPEMADTKPEFTPVLQKEPKLEFTTANKLPTDAEIVAYIDVRGKMPAYKEVVKSFKIDKKANSTYELSISDRAELYGIIKDMEESL